MDVFIGDMNFNIQNTSYLCGFVFAAIVHYNDLIGKRRICLLYKTQYNNCYSQKCVKV